MKKNRILTESEKRQIIDDKQKVIIESFRSTFNKIKRIDENELSDIESTNTFETFEAAFDYVIKDAQSMGHILDMYDLASKSPSLYEGFYGIKVGDSASGTISIIEPDDKVPDFEQPITGGLYMRIRRTGVDEYIIEKTSIIGENNLEINEMDPNVDYEELWNTRRKAHKEYPYEAEFTDFLNQHDRMLRKKFNKYQFDTEDYELPFIEFAKYVFDGNQNVVFDPQMNEGVESDTYFKTLASALDYVRNEVSKMGYELDEDDMWSSFGTGGVGYGETKRGTITLLKDGKPLLSKRGKPLNRGIQIVIYRMDSGTYELTWYKTW
jgi:hypothetical protein